LLVAAPLALTSTAGIARNIPGVPKELVGLFADSRDRCGEGAPFNLEEDNDFRFCAGSSDDIGSTCNFQVLSHRPTATGFVLALKDRTDGDMHELKVTALKKDIFKLTLAGESETIRRCSKDAETEEKDDKSAPRFLIGLFAKDAAQCRSAQRFSLMLSRSECTSFALSLSIGAAFPGSMPVNSKCMPSFAVRQLPPHEKPHFAAISVMLWGISVTSIGFRPFFPPHACGLCSFSGSAP
jgi:hypothetical protein